MKKVISSSVYLFGVFTGLILFIHVQGQDTVRYKYWNPATEKINVLEGKAWTGETREFYDRLPAYAEQTVRREVWDLSKNSAGLQFRFRTNAEQIIVQMKVSGELQFPHMPATGVSGVDLYTKNIDGKWLWCAGRFSFGDTVVFKYLKLTGHDQHVKDREYTLYLPLYNSVKWMEIKVPEQNSFQPLPVRNEKPILVYGTSIAQGACASRPGMAWTNILSRRMDYPVINLGFSGNGRLEKEVIDLIAEVDAKLFILDCLPNLVGGGNTSPVLKSKIVAAIAALQSKRPAVPILLCQHDGYTDDAVSTLRKKEYETANFALQEVFDSLITNGAKNLYLLTKEEINQDIESMVDGVHPNDMGMIHYANAYERKIRVIFHEPAGNISTAIAVTQRRDAAIYDWETRHNEVLNYNRTHSPQLLFIGNSITHYWAGEPAAPIQRGTDSWNRYFAKYHPANLGYGWDRIENVLWRVYHGELDGFAAKLIVLNIGTNNLGINSDDEIVSGISNLLNTIRSRQPSAKIFVSGIYPRRNMENRVAGLNKKIAAMAVEQNISFINPGTVLLNPEMTIDESLFTDGLHPNAEGYRRLGAAIKKNLDE